MFFIPNSDNFHSYENRKRQANKKILNFKFEILLVDIHLHLWMKVNTGCFPVHIRYFYPYFFTMNQQPLVGQGLLIIEDSHSHSDTLHSVGLLWMSDQLVAETLPDNTQHSQETIEPATPTIKQLQTYDL